MEGEVINFLGTLKSGSSQIEWHWARARGTAFNSCFHSWRDNRQPREMTRLLSLRDCPEIISRVVSNEIRLDWSFRRRTKLYLTFQLRCTLRQVSRGATLCDSLGF